MWNVGVAHSRALGEGTLTYTHFLQRIYSITLPWKPSMNPFYPLIPSVQLELALFPIPIVSLWQSTLGLSPEVPPACSLSFGIMSWSCFVFSKPESLLLPVEDDSPLSGYITVYLAAVLTLPGEMQTKSNHRRWVIAEVPGARNGKEAPID